MRSLKESVLVKKRGRTLSSGWPGINGSPGVLCYVSHKRKPLKQRTSQLDREVKYDEDRKLALALTKWKLLVTLARATVCS